ncbi:hypothetical protein A2873_03785 [Candidatus Woesebacteria bacterium RIFCSPHIGHO2_01_FULL_42_80]|nr:MAG: hypothetical protein A2873_03785 [Candidatus Woesebacteria bacterium RIFCSPHIGHO2_01_FULL_42_80]OGM66588.1 MAG: hypothetical protein A2969_01345 [Candidatus Woesebacteria bacterium RIFCSPLOWO2_01_FULL_42_67]OGM70979.1 MAG: hypothetical protein A3I55_04615 [Candidatus Woesebacteria bacterium RIFCSPLOWO2_02_FULL_42_10]
MSQKILIVEDEDSLLSALVDKFLKAGYRVVTARDGEEGLTVALREQPDLILLDIVMPKMDGIALLRQLRDNSWGQGVPVILLTNLTDSKKIGEGMDLKAENFLVKSDWKIEDVVGKVKDKLRGNATNKSD